MDVLCDDILDLILNRVINPKDQKSVSRVCKRWLKTLNPSTIRVSQSHLLRRLLPTPNLVKLKICWFSVSNDDLEFVAQTCPNLEILTLFLGNPSYDEVGEGLCAIATKCPKLSKVTLMEGNNICEDGVVQFLTLARNLTHLKLGGREWVTHKSLKAISSLSCLKQLDLSHCYRITDCSLEFLAHGSVSNHLGHCRWVVSSSCSKTIKKLNLGSCPRISESGFSHLQEMCVLEELHLYDSEHVTNRTLKFLSRGSVSKTMKKLNICGCYKVTDFGVSFLRKMCVLEDLNLSACFHVKGCGLGFPSKTMKKLDLKYCSNITDAGLSLLREMSVLEELDLSGCELITDRGLEYLTNAPFSKTMKKLSLCNCDKITESGVLLLQKMCVLEELDLHDSLVTKDVKAVLFSAIPTLKFLGYE